MHLSTRKQCILPLFNLAIIGAGISGTSAAYFLSKNTELNATINIYSKDVGGRLQTILISDREFETGGSILHPRNQYMKKFVEEFGKNVIFYFRQILNFVQLCSNI